MLTLSQGFAALDAVAPTPLPGPPLWERYLLENPWPLVLLLGAAVVVGVFVLSRLGKPHKARWIAGAGILLMALVAALAWGIETQREQLEADTRALIRAVAAGDVGGVDGLLAVDAVLLTPFASRPFSRSEILSRVGSEFAPGGAYRLRGCALLAFQAHIADDGAGQVQVKVRADPENGPPTPAWVRLDWEQDAAGRWRAGGISVLSVGGVAGGMGRGPVP